MESVRVSFKKDKKETGLQSIGMPTPCTFIKFNGKEVGDIWINDGAFSPKGKQGWRIRIQIKHVPTEENPCPWVWASFGAVYETEPMARAWVKENAKKLFEVCFME